MTVLQAIAPTTSARTSSLFRSPRNPATLIVPTLSSLPKSASRIRIASTPFEPLHSQLGDSFLGALRMSREIQIDMKGVPQSGPSKHSALAASACSEVNGILCFM